MIQNQTGHRLNVPEQNFTELDRALFKRSRIQNLTGYRQDFPKQDYTELDWARNRILQNWIIDRPNRSAEQENTKVGRTQPNRSRKGECITRPGTTKPFQKRRMYNQTRHNQTVLDQENTERGQIQPTCSRLVEYKRT